MQYNYSESHSFRQRINVRCKDGFAQKIGDVGDSNVFCTEFGWSPLLFKLLKCAREFELYLLID